MSTEFKLITPAGHTFQFKIEQEPTCSARCYWLDHTLTWVHCIDGQNPIDLQLLVECYMCSWFGTPPPQGPLEKAKHNTRDMYKRIGPRPL